MFKKLLIANRGEIAVRIGQTCREMGICTVAVYSEADREALHVRTLDEAVCIGPGQARESYLSIERIIQAAVSSGAEAVHPGYGFLSESAEFAKACRDAGLAFVGPKPETLRLVGDKSAARRLATSVGVAVVPGYDGEAQDDESLLAAARGVGYPLLVKATGGGGGRGIRPVHRKEEFAEAVASARREAISAFGRGELLLERYLERPRHVEVQVVGDEQGALLQLGERECSVQRRYQKVVEEAPSPGVDGELRRRLAEAALRIASAAGYTNAGTVEFLLDADGEFYFLEVNPRIQVEHPVTEWVTGLDLVRWQIMVTAGERLPVSQGEVETRGHAIEARIFAEDPSEGYLPGGGALERFEPPLGPWIRNDVGVYAGYEVPTFYDAMLAKVTVFGRDRAEAVLRLALALGRYEVSGVATNLAMLRLVAEDAEFAEGRTDTQFLERRIEPLLRRDESLPWEVLVSAVAYKLASSGLAGGSSGVGLGAGGDAGTGLGAGRGTWRGGPWRLGRAGMEFRFRYGEKELRCEASYRPWTGRWAIDAGEGVFDVGVEMSAGGGVAVKVGPERWSVEANESDGGLNVTWRGRVYRLEEGFAPSVRRAAGELGGLEGSRAMEAPMPGTIARVEVKEGEGVTEHQTLLVLEAMKMEHLIVAPRAGVVKRVLVKERQQVSKGEALVEVEGRNQSGGIPQTPLLGA